MQEPEAGSPETHPMIWAFRYAPIKDRHERSVLMSIAAEGDESGMVVDIHNLDDLAEKSFIEPDEAERICRDLEERHMLRRQADMWEVLVPAEFWTANHLARINRDREVKGYPPITKQNRPWREGRKPYRVDSDKYMREAVAALLHAVEYEADFPGWLAQALATAASHHKNGTWKLVAGRPGTWQAGAVRRLLDGTVGDDIEALQPYWDMPGGLSDPEVGWPPAEESEE